MLVSAVAISAYGQERKITGRVVSSTQAPVAGAVLSFPGMDNVTTASDGTFQITLKDGVKNLSVWAPGYYPVSRLIDGRSEMVIMMIPDSKYKYNESAVLPFRIENKRIEGTAAANIAKKDFTPGSMMIDRALNGQVAGLQAIRNGGMPGEASYFNMRGLRSLTAENAPLIIIDGVPHMPDNHASQLINGFSRDILQAYNINDIQNITVLKGADASAYGSLGANGVILIETDGATSDDLDTKISFYGQYGVSFNKDRMSLLRGSDYKSYLTDVGMTYFGNMESMFNEFPFLSSSANRYDYLYSHNTDWQELIYDNAFVTDNMFRVEGGDEIAKYDFSIGYTNEGGILKGTSMENYHTRLNTNVLVSPKVELTAGVGLSYLSGNYQNQGMEVETNPVLAAYARSPYLNPYAMDEDGKVLNGVYSSYYYGKSTNMDFATSNPLALIHEVKAKNHQYDINVRAGVNYKPITDLLLSGTLGLYYNHNKESLFIPGVTDKSVMPMYDQYGVLNNTVKEGVNTTFNMFVNLNAHYTHTFAGVHKLSALAGVQLLTTSREYDAGTGRNTANDFFQTLDKANTLGRYFFGYTEKWNWMNYYAHADYTYNDMWKASVNLSVDGSSSSGVDAARFYVYPSVGLTWIGKSLKSLQDASWINRLDVRAEYSLTGNSRFSASYGKLYYTSLPYDAVSGIVRGNISNPDLKPERNAQLNVGADLAFLNDRLNLSVDYYLNKTTDGVIRKQLSPGFGTGSFYANMAEIQNQGIEASVAASVVRTKDFDWVLGGNIARNKGEIKSLGTNADMTTSFSDGAQLLNRVGLAPYQFYGLQANGVYSTQAEAEAANLLNANGVKYQAGDVRFVDQNGDGRIDDKDRVALGSAAPSFFGGFFTKLRYKGFSLSAEFAYSKGNKAYNAVRRSLETLAGSGNQSEAALNRWTLEGQNTQMPRANWGDPMGNANFSSRWIEDASYLRMKNVTLSYDFNTTIWNFFRSGTIYVTGENLLTFTEYLGLDPEFSYSYADNIQGFDYAKLMQPKTVKLGINLKF